MEGMRGELVSLNREQVGMCVRKMLTCALTFPGCHRNVDKVPGESQPRGGHDPYWRDLSASAWSGQCEISGQRLKL